jgi:hypothetical protein
MVSVVCLFIFNVCGLSFKFYAGCWQGTVYSPDCQTLRVSHRDNSLIIERVNMHVQGFACTGSFDMVLTSVDGQKLQHFNFSKIIFL